MSLILALVARTQTGYRGVVRAIELASSARLGSEEERLP